MYLVNSDIICSTINKLVNGKHTQKTKWYNSFIIYFHYPRNHIMKIYIIIWNKK